MVTAIKHPTVPYRVKSSFVIFDTRALGHSEKINATINSYPPKFLKRLQIPPPYFFHGTFHLLHRLYGVDAPGVQITKLGDVNCCGFKACISWRYQRFCLVDKTHLVLSVACADEDETFAISSLA